MKFALHIARRARILSLLESGVTGIAVTLVLGCVVAVVHSGLLMVE